MSSHPPDTFFVGGACGALGCTSNLFGHPTSLSLMPYPFTSHQGVANVYRSTLLLSMVITQNLDVSGGTFLPVRHFFRCRCLDFFSPSDIVINGARSAFLLIRPLSLTVPARHFLLIWNLTFPSYRIQDNLVFHTNFVPEFSGKSQECWKYSAEFVTMTPVVVPFPQTR